MALKLASLADVMATTEQHDNMLAYAEGHNAYSELYGHMDTTIPSRFNAAKRDTIKALESIIQACIALGYDMLAREWQETLDNVKRARIAR